MAEIRAARGGEPLTIKHSQVKFSLWPVGRTIRRFRLQSQIFVAHVWPLIAEAVETKCPQPTREAAHAFRRQSEDYFKAASLGEVTAARPVLLYYCSNVPASGKASSGVLRHKGWKADKIDLPLLSPSTNTSVIAPAEVEI